MLMAEDLTEQVIGLAIEMHRYTGRGLLESVYEQCLHHELRRAILPVHEAQLHTYLAMSGIRVGLILNFNARQLVEGLRRHIV